VQRASLPDRYQAPTASWAADAFLLRMAVERKASIVLFLCLFASQSGLIALSPVLVDVASDFGVSTAEAGQLRTIAGLAAGFTALALPVVARRLCLRPLLVSGACLLAVGAVTTGAAPTFAVLALAQLLVGVAVAVVVASATAAAAEWAPPEGRARVLSWALIGNPAAWIVGMPVIGLLGEASWRYGSLALPLAAAIAAAVTASRAPGCTAKARDVSGISAALSDPSIRRWALSELAANSAWIGVLVYAGALFVESYGSSSAATGVILAVAAAAFLAGNLAFRRAAARDPRRLLIRLALAMAVLVALFGAVRPTTAVSAIVLASTAFLGGGRSLLGNAVGLHAARDRRVAAMAARAAANQFGYFVGAAAGGLALSLSGYAGLGLLLALLFVLAAAALVDRRPAPAATQAATA
jgi:predicted MFS family arabinose efflux permease